MRHGSLFSGIGGFDLAAEWMGWENVFHCEWNQFGQRILKYYWQKAISYENICTTDFSVYRGKIDIITGGFPCQPYSAAGKRKGKDDERHLWPQMLRAIREIQPTWVVGENVFGIVNWSGGMVFDEVQTDLEAQGYEVQPYVLPAVSVDAPHRRDRVWFVAYSSVYANGLRTTGGVDVGGQLLEGRERKQKTDEFGIHNKNAADTDINRLQRIMQSECNDQQGRYRSGEFTKECLRSRWRGMEAKKWQDFPTQPPICGRNDGFSNELDGITFSKWRNESIKGYGNAVVPQVVLQIFKAIAAYEQNT